MSWRALNSKVRVGGALGVQVKSVALRLNSASLWRETPRLQGGKLMHRTSCPAAYFLSSWPPPLAFKPDCFLGHILLAGCKEEASCGVLCLAGKLAAPLRPLDAGGVCCEFCGAGHLFLSSFRGLPRPQLLDVHPCRGMSSIWSESHTWHMVWYSVDMECASGAVPESQCCLNRRHFHS